MTKITKNTIFSFVQKNKSNLYFKLKSRFDGMTDCVEFRSDSIHQVTEFLSKDHSEFKHTCGVPGAFFTSSTRNFIEAYEDGLFEGYEVSNCCGSFYLLRKKAA